MPSSMRNIIMSRQKNDIVESPKVEKEEEVVMFLKIGSVGKNVSLLQNSLKTLGYYNDEVDGIFGLKTENSVEKFQEKLKILVDGIAGSGTVGEIDRLLVKSGNPVSGIVLGVSKKLNEPVKKMRWIKCPADIFPGRGGYGSLTLRSDVAKAYKELYDDVHSLGGIITTAGGKRSLTSKTSPSRSKKSMHYVGLAFDLALPTGMQNSNTDPFIVVDQGDRRWEVWCRTEDESVPVVTLESSTATTKSGKTVVIKKKVIGRFFSFTELASHHGFKPIRARRSFFKGGSYTGAEWWHFQWEKGLISGKSIFGEELLRVYPLERCKKFSYWNEVKSCTFGIDWF